LGAKDLVMDYTYEKIATFAVGDGAIEVPELSNFDISDNLSIGQIPPDPDNEDFGAKVYAAHKATGRPYVELWREMGGAE
jgi:hypothetical protein